MVQISLKQREETFQQTEFRSNKVLVMSVKSGDLRHRKTLAYFVFWTRCALNELDQSLLQWLSRVQTSFVNDVKQRKLRPSKTSCMIMVHKMIIFYIDFFLVVGQWPKTEPLAHCSISYRRVSNLTLLVTIITFIFVDTLFREFWLLEFT